MLSGAFQKQFRTYLKIQVGHGWSVEKKKRFSISLEDNTEAIYSYKD